MRSTVGQESIGTSTKVRAVLDQLKVLAPADSAVLIQGETGTGKELMARAMNSQNRRSPEPSIRLNCAAMPPELLESELFGHERRAFTGTFAQGIGRLQLTHKGTLFLDV